MNVAFADTYYFLALAVESDAAHASAVHFLRTSSADVVTSDWILVEVADALCKPRTRRLTQRLFDGLRKDPKVTIVNANRQHLEIAYALYVERNDKDWSLTDCLSFIIMQEFGITDAITGDHHFSQAGFNLLLPNSPS